MNPQIETPEFAVVDLATPLDRQLDKVYAQLMEHVNSHSQVSCGGFTQTFAIDGRVGTKLCGILRSEYGAAASELQVTVPMERFHTLHSTLEIVEEPGCYVLTLEQPREALIEIFNAFTGSAISVTRLQIPFPDFYLAEQAQEMLRKIVSIASL